MTYKRSDRVDITTMVAVGGKGVRKLASARLLAEKTSPAHLSTSVIVEEYLGHGLPADGTRSVTLREFFVGHVLEQLVIKWDLIERISSVLGNDGAGLQAGKIEKVWKRLKARFPRHGFGPLVVNVYPLVCRHDGPRVGSLIEIRLVGVPILDGQKAMEAIRKTVGRFVSRLQPKAEACLG